MSARILVVDDEPMLRALLVRILCDAGYRVDAMPDGLKAFEWAQNADPPFDLIITNNFMPHMRGDELIQRLRELAPGMPILHVSGDQSDSGARAEFPIPADVPTLYKPFNADRFLDQVRSLLKAHSG